MFKIRGEDGKEFGPVIAAVIRQWITHGKANADSRVQRVGESEWKPLSSVPEFAAEFRHSETPAQAAAPVAQMPARTSGMAVTSFVLGLLGFFILPAFVGLGLGIIAHTRISGSNCQLKGAGWATAGMIASGLMLLIGLPFWSALVLPAMAEARSQSHASQCLANMETLSLAVQSYAKQHDGAYPPMATWCDALVASGIGDGFQCPSKPRLKSGYAMNAGLADKHLTNVAPNTVLLFECNMGWNAVGGPADMATTRHLKGGVIVAFANGTTERVPAWQIPQLKWIP